MKQLLTDIRTRLRSQIAAVDGNSVLILLDKAVLPGYVALPAIGIKDNGISFEPADVRQGRQLRIFQVEISAYVSIPDPDTPEAPIMGDGTNQGVLDLMENILAALTNWNLSGTQYSARPLRVEPSAPMPLRLVQGSDGELRGASWVQRLDLNFQVKRQKKV